MARARTGPTPPRASPPDLPERLDSHTAMAARDDLSGVSIDAMSGDVSLAHGRLIDGLVEGASLGRWDLTGATLTDVRIADLRANEVITRDGAWRSVEIIGGRIATLDASRAAWDGVRLEGLRIDYLSLAAADVGDLVLVGCDIGTLDVPQARLVRVAFEDCRVDEVDTRGLRGEHLDLRGLEALRFTDTRGLTGATLSVRQAELHGPAFAAALGIRLAPGS